ncbi:hypothetical protein A3A67_01455 [Candidatus Peribacteria bacterium RIFCSPLOWO2_01_FULL_51_18]|nr:MAG: hypothetical protein A3C52_03045 [Candidatus Peribacteria bacterium RIFCSPHIGHO2_02_FULL_51_15]OGJ65371.1 MAG: hypothetical protein A3A67_01455 [Candidatus Peribacteria bacterium RIFCSPLOWO2_01_FULL_51_18]OGJ69602.1 MAG: hypothetical protein A3J34_00125 [Candidatus Peribacteria bacterium RIFCSPLOWO2_02_FULL_51_10]
MPTQPMLSVTLPVPLAEAEKKVKEALSDQQFGIISEIDIQSKLKEKLGVSHPPHKILGACNPRLAYQALSGNADAALVMPCNVVLRELDKKTVVTVLLPTNVLERFPGEGVNESARIAEEGLKEAFDFLLFLYS